MSQQTSVLNTFHSLIWSLCSTVCPLATAETATEGWGSDSVPTLAHVWPHTLDHSLAVPLVRFVHTLHVKRDNIHPDRSNSFHCITSCSRCPDTLNQREAIVVTPASVCRSCRAVTPAGEIHAQGSGERQQQSNLSYTHAVLQQSLAWNYGFYLQNKGFPASSRDLNVYFFNQSLGSSNYYTETNIIRPKTQLFLLLLLLFVPPAVFLSATCHFVLRSND